MAGSSIATVKLLLSLTAGLGVAAVGAGYVIKDDAGQPVIQSLLSGNGETATLDSAHGKSETLKEGDQVAALPGKTAEPEAAPEPASDPVAPDAGKAVPPVFHVLRVEPDGSIVIAGNAPANSEVEIIENGNVLATGKAGAGGDFAFVFDNPLAPGAYELFIRARPAGEDGAAEPVMSVETGIVTIPGKDEAGGQVLALIQQPGAPSRILQQPEATPEPAEPVETAEQAPEAVTPSDPAASEADTEVALADPQTTQQQSGETPPAVEEVPLVEEATEAETPVETTAETPVEPVETAVDTPPAKPAELVQLNVQAVDVEASRMFIAGQGEPGSRVQVYINNEFKAAGVVNSQGGFLVELAESLTTGQHDLRVDQVGNGGEVANRVAVVIEHEAAEPETPPAPPVTHDAEAVTVSGETTVAEAAQSETQVAETQVAETQVAENQVAENQDAETQAAAVEQAPSQVEEAASEAPAPAVEASTETPVGQVAAAAVEEPAARVIKTGTSVIIRRGDNLWQISRRMLGQGRKYTLIFEANADQIKDPNRIWPGQVFDVPDAASAEDAGREG